MCAIRPPLRRAAVLPILALVLILTGGCGGNGVDIGFAQGIDVVNQGRIDANVAGQSLTLRSTNTFQNDGTVRASNGGGVVQLTVQDDGPGIDEAILDQVFDPFVTTKAAGQGTGLGLAVCHTIVERLGGSIEAENLEQGGAAFEVTLPAAT